jgi:predicted metal-binding protein
MCAGGKCLRALKNREGAFSIYKDKEVELVGYTACGGCPGGNIEYAPEEMKKRDEEERCKCDTSCYGTGRWISTMPSCDGFS